MGVLELCFFLSYWYNTLS